MTRENPFAADAMSVELGYREKQILRLLLRGQTNKEIAVALNLAEKTVKGDFVDGCEIQPPFHLIALGSHGSVSVSRQSDTGLAEVCRHDVGPGITSPVVVAVVAGDDAVSRTERRCPFLAEKRKRYARLELFGF